MGLQGHVMSRVRHASYDFLATPLRFTLGDCFLRASLSDSAVFQREILGYVVMTRRSGIAGQKICLAIPWPGVCHDSRFSSKQGLVEPGCSSRTSRPGQNGHRAAS